MRMAANQVTIGDTTYTNHVVELEDDCLLRHYPLSEELAHTQWFRRIVIHDGKLLERVDL